ncbi:MAG: hypothetical protein ACREH4_15020 [Vitreimonas sp.]
MTRARQCTPALFCLLLEEACPHSATSGYCTEARAIRRLAEAGAWTDAALALVKLELPNWTVRRLQRDGGEWYCALSPHGDLPDWLDDAKEARHADLALAILLALIETPAEAASSTSQAGPMGDSIALCCENFS